MNVSKSSESFNTFFPTCAWIAKDILAPPIRRNLTRLVTDHKKTYPNQTANHFLSDIYTTINYNPQLFKEEDYKELSHCILSNCRSYYKELEIDVDSYSFTFTEMWFNISHKGQYQDKHRHPNCLTSGSYYLAVPPNSGALYLHSPLNSQLIVPVKKGTLENTSLVTIEPQENSLILFPSWLEHSVGQNKFDELRISISFNINIYPKSFPNELIEKHGSPSRC